MEDIGEGFYVVIRDGDCSPRGFDNAPTKIHYTKSDAHAEASRLATHNIGVEFSIFKAIAVVCAEATVSTEEL